MLIMVQKRQKGSIFHMALLHMEEEVISNSLESKENIKICGLVIHIFKQQG